VAAARARDADPVLARLALLPQRLEGLAGGRRQHGPARRGWHLGRLRPQLLPALAHRGRCRARPRRAASLFRGLRGRHHPRAAGQVLGKPGQTADRFRHPGADEASSGAGTTAPARRARGGGRRREREGRRPGRWCARASGCRWTASCARGRARSTSRSSPARACRSPSTRATG
jgi:hypothetical protein